MSLDVTYEPAMPGDLDALLELRIEAMRESLERIGRFDPVRARERLASGFDPACTRHVLADGRRVGFVVVRPHPEGLLLDHLYLRPEEQGRGIGSRVLREVLADADARRLPVLVGALRESASNAFYLRHGFHPLGESEWDIDYRRHPAVNRNARRILWTDASAGAVAGLTVLLLRDWLARLHAFPIGLVVFIGWANVAYASYSGTLALRAQFEKRPSRRALELLVFANASWVVVCAAVFVASFRFASVWGLAHLTLEGAFVGALALVEWRFVRPSTY